MSIRLRRAISKKTSYTEEYFSSDDEYEEENHSLCSKLVQSQQSISSASKSNSNFSFSSSSSSVDVSVMKPNNLISGRIQTKFLHMLPSDVLYIIMSYQRLQVNLAARSVCKRLLEICQHSASFNYTCDIKFVSPGKKMGITPAIKAIKIINKDNRCRHLVLGNHQFGTTTFKQLSKLMPRLESFDAGWSKKLEHVTDNFQMFDGSKLFPHLKTFKWAISYVHGTAYANLLHNLPLLQNIDLGHVLSIVNDENFFTLVKHFNLKKLTITGRIAITDAGFQTFLQNNPCVSDIKLHLQGIYAKYIIPFERLTFNHFSPAAADIFRSSKNYKNNPRAKLQIIGEWPAFPTTTVQSIIHRNQINVVVEHENENKSI